MSLMTHMRKLNCPAEYQRPVPKRDFVFKYHIPERLVPTVLHMN